MNEKLKQSDSLEQRRIKYRNSIPGRVAEVRNAIDLFKDAPTKENLEALVFLVHTLAGNSGIYGYDKVTTLCKFWDRRLFELSEDFSSCELSSEFFTEIEGMFQSLKEGFDLK